MDVRNLKIIHGMGSHQLHEIWKQLPTVRELVSRDH
jgi:hypothetical protein